MKCGYCGVEGFFCLFGVFFVLWVFLFGSPTVCILLYCTERLNSVKFRNKLDTRSFKSIEKCKVLSSKPSDKTVQLKGCHNTSILKGPEHQVIERGYQVPSETHTVK